MPSQRPFFLSTFFASFRQTSNPISQQPNKHTSQTTPSSSAAYTTQQQSNASTSASAPRAVSTNAHPGTSSSSRSGGVVSQLPLHSPRGTAGPSSPRGVPIPGSPPGRRRGSDSSSEGFREVLGSDKWYIGGRTATGEERFFKLGVVRRVRSNDGLSLDRLSL
ncbi:hypothetical protein SODALDRAFT_27019 [Sodiomyces alkalinus F11]|uniref:Uncharacterized protein n=1 Tax=Sodiomyces alkalinus (strain CBS 110278 / VKM F-3762 / F11) TaxID=1314773 RepID=A0A3N2Q8J1_SODAK|nr:hypothetical protein SODALDRAFT_27019 [Sodiomyces alkalinus F11]ROT42935.1 hypothetical protein SODALDRAFT_27019 [Sodiomyces alkalinus F11]